MLPDPILIKPSAAFWREVARAVIDGGRCAAGAGPLDLSAMRIAVPAFVHAAALKAELARQLDRAFIPPRIATLSAWLDQLPPEPAHAAAQADGARLMALYAGLRQHGWLKKLFGVRRNTDLLPLAQTLLALSDELTQALLPAVRMEPDAVRERWEAALQQLPPSARTLLSDEAQLVWSIWKSQLDGNDPCVIRFARMMRLAAQAREPLVWVAPVAPDAFERAFLEEYAARQPVQLILLDWRQGALPPLYEQAWKELIEEGEAAPHESVAAAAPQSGPDSLRLYPAKSLEDEAQCGAQTIIDWLAGGKSSVAIVAQDRVVARRIRALLERAGVYVSDETGWKLSTTRAAAAIDAWFEAVSSQAETVALLDLLKSPFLFAAMQDKTLLVMAIEATLRGHNVLGGWEAVSAALEALPAEREAIQRLSQQAGLYSGRRSLAGWLAVTAGTLDTLGMRAALESDPAGMQVLQALDEVARDCGALDEEFSFAEWRAFVGLELEAAPYRPPELDKRVAMLPLNGARLRAFDAVLMVGADADHLPSRPQETLFMANAVRRELGLGTRESRQRQQLRDFTELLCASPLTVLSWQASRDGEPSPVSLWIQRLQLAAERRGTAGPARHEVALGLARLRSAPPGRPLPAAPQLLPSKLSASGYNSLVACPYQFFAERMLGLAGMDELSELPAKRDYGDWLHRILAEYHEQLGQGRRLVEEREALLRSISERVFGEALERSGAALAYYARWNRALPAYLAWANEREAAGWRFVLGEQWLQTTLSWDGGAITLHGRIDRIDENADGERAVLDYKTKDAKSLQKRLKEAEDHQLAFYGLLSEAPVARAHYVALEPVKDKTGDAEAERYDEWQQALREQIRAGMQALAQGAPLPASGIESVCRYCGVRGLCRKGAW